MRKSKRGFERVEQRGRLKRLICCFLIFCFLSISNVISAQSPDEGNSFLGTWHGTHSLEIFPTDEFRTRVFFHIKKKKEGVLTGSFDIPARHINNIPLTNIKANGDSLSFTVRGFGIPFHGRINKDDTVITGELENNKLTFVPLKAPMNSVMLENPFAESYHGITSDGTPDKNLFTINKTAVTTAPVVKAANRFLNTLNSSQYSKVSFPVDADEWRHWSNSPFLKRRGVSLRDMSNTQRNAALSLIQASLSAKGFTLSRDIMRIEDYIKNLTGNSNRFGEFLFHMTIMGDPSQEEPWGWQLDGHHLVINYFVLGNQVVMTPAFFGSEPTAIDTGRYAGTEVLQKEQNQGLAFMQSLNNEQQNKARIGNKKTKEHLQARPFNDNMELEYAGLSAKGMSPSQRDSLLSLIKLYVSNMREGHAEIRMKKIRQHLDETHFAWVGEDSSNAVYYYRIHSPVILLEFDHAVPRSLPVDKQGPYRNHIHTIMRTPNGNDYGKSLLWQHYKKHENDPSHQHHK